MTAAFGEGIAVPPHPHDRWMEPSQKERQDRIVGLMREDNPQFLAVVDRWADLLLEGELGAYEDRSELVYARTVAGRDIKFPGHFTYENPFPDRRGFIEYTQDELEPGNPILHLALDAAVKTRDPNAFVAMADPELFDPYYGKSAAEKGHAHFYVLGRNDGSTEHPEQTANKALVVVQSDTPRAELAPRFSAEGATAREVAKAEIEQGWHEWKARNEASCELGKKAMQLLTANAVARLIEALDQQYSLGLSDRPDGNAREVLNAIFIPGRIADQRRAPSTIQELLDNMQHIRYNELAVAFARLYPEDTPEQLAARLV